ncbi:MAG: chemotaxis protein CheA [Treponema sp.]|nr:chemotaxis protein CheA [Treponema sp.]
MSDYLDPNNEELLKDFFAEAEQQVEQLESNVLVIENDPANHEAIDEIFRAAHTLKGGSATVEMMELSSFTHSVEDVLDEIRSDRLAVDEDVVDLLLTSIDVIKAMLESRRNGVVYEEDTSEVLNKLHAYLPGDGGKGGKGGKEKTKAKAPAGMGPSISKAPKVEPVASPAVSQVPGIQTPSMEESEYREMLDALEAGQKLWCVAVKFDESNPMNSVGGIQVFAALKNAGNVLKTVPDFDALYEDQFYEFVYYYIGSSESAEKLEDISFLSDVTLLTDAHQITEENFAGGAAKSAPAPVTAAAPVAPAPVTPVASPSPAPVAAPVSTPAPAAVAATPSSASSSSANTVTEDKPKAAAPAQGGASAQGSILRVDSRRIDYLLNLVSETVITKASFNQLSMQLANENVVFASLQNSYKERIRRLMDQLPAYLEKVRGGQTVAEVRKEMLKEYGDLGTVFDAYDTDQKAMTGKFRTYTQTLGRIASELQEGVMKIRMVPINQIFSRFPRVVRDLQRDLNKKIQLVIEGEDTELDKSVVEDLLDPVMHCVRNSVDHGIEMPAARIAAGKPETGTVLLKASNEGNMIVIEISDDGAGIDVEKVKAKAIEKGLIHPDKVLSEQDAFNLIMEPGFSTADHISNISGRGVGLDVVRTMIAKLNGTMSITSSKGKGTSFIIRLPLTLAIIQGLLVRVGKEVYSIPIANVIESQCINQKDISRIDNYETMEVRNEVISVLRLSRLFGIRETMESDECYVVIVGSQEKKIGVMVDALIGEEDVVIKPLRDQFTNSPGIAGASILGDGSVSLIIDVSQLLELGVRQELSAQGQAMD